MDERQELEKQIARLECKLMTIKETIRRTNAAMFYAVFAGRVS